MTARGSRHTSARICQSAASSPAIGGRARCAARRRSRCRAARRTVAAPGGGDVADAAALASAFSAANVSTTSSRSQCARPRSTPASFDECAPSARRRRARGRRGRPGARAPADAMISRQPGSPSSTKPERNDSRICMRLRQRERDDPAAAFGGDSSGAQLVSCPAGLAAVTPSTFQLSGRSAASDMSVSRSTSSSVKPLRQPAMISSSVVPGMVAHGRRKRDQLVARRAARRHRIAVAVVVGRRLRGREAHRARVEARRAARRPSARSARAGAGSPTASLAHHGAAQRRVADEEAGVDRDAALSSRSSQSPKSSSPTAARPRARRAACPRRAPSSA